MSLAAETTLFAGSDSLSISELALYHAINDLRVSKGLTPLKPSLDLSVLSGQHAVDFDVNVGYAGWAQAGIAARPVPSLHHWSDGQSFVSGVLALASGLKLAMPQSIAENAEGLLAAHADTDVLSGWLANPGTSGNLLSTSWDAIGVGMSGSMVYVSFGNYTDGAAKTAVVPILGTSGGDSIRTTAWADNIQAGGGNDVIYGLTNGDRVDGGTGLDRVTLSGTAASYTIAPVAAENGTTWAVITGAEGQISIHNVEYVQFADRIVDSSNWGENLTQVRFDDGFYGVRNVDVAAAVTGGAISSLEDHFWSFGAHEDRDPASFFDTDYYLAHNPDIAAAIAAGTVRSAFEHYLLFGQFEGRDPNAYFNSADYLALNPDVAAAIAAGAVGSAIDHYLTFGRYEGRLATDQFSESFYLAHNPDVAAAVAVGLFDSGLSHYRLIGQNEGRLPFDADISIGIG
ncbi:CAP domain-containing protein [Niveispirillum sp. KHB5.9]|uniref:CAP domain-containing protein n=1 Tax=Niveispirillum sp. KHB5.9 TaxID=3400269 RepID=UPI003A884ABC